MSFKLNPLTGKLDMVGDGGSIGDTVGGANNNRVLTTDASGDLSDDVLYAANELVAGGALTATFLTPIGFTKARFFSADIGTSEVVGWALTTGEASTFVFANPDTLATYMSLAKDATDIANLNITPNGVDTMFSVSPNGIKASDASSRISLFSTDGTLAGNSDSTIPTERAIKSYVDAIGGGTGIVVDDELSVLSMTPDDPTLAFATDTEKKYLWDGTNWRAQSLRLPIENEAPDMGSGQDSDKLGYTKDDITDKKLHNIVIQGSERQENGSLRVDVDKDPNTFEIYLRDEWQTIIYDLTTQTGDFRHTPLDKPVYVWRGDSVEVGANSQPMIQEYKTSMGSHPGYRKLTGRTF